MPSVSVTIAILTYNRPEYLADALRSACDQTIPVQEILVIDDGSGPETRKLVESFQKHWPQIRYVWKENGGHSPARNRAVEECRTTHLMWLDDDDALTPGALQSHFQVLQQCPEADVIYGEYMLCNEHLVPLERQRFYPFDHNRGMAEMFTGNRFPNPGTLVSKACFDKVGPYDEAYRHVEDYDFWARAVSLGARFVYHDSVVLYYRSHDTNLATVEKLQKVNHEIVAVMESIITRHPIEQICPELPWAEHPELCFYHACVHAAYHFCRFDGWASSVEVMRQLDLPAFEERASFLGKLLTTLGNGDKAGLCEFFDDSRCREPEILRFFDLFADKQESKTEQAQLRSFVDQHRRA